MADYQRMYYVLCRAVDAVVDPLDQIPAAASQAAALREALLEAEEIYLRTNDSRTITIERNESRTF